MSVFPLWLLLAVLRWYSTDADFDYAYYLHSLFFILLLIGKLRETVVCAHLFQNRYYRFCKTFSLVLYTIVLVQDRDRWWPWVNTVVKVGFHKRRKNFD